MSVGSWFFGFLSGDSGVSNLVGSRIYPNKAPQNPTTPYITYSTSSGQRIHHSQGASGLSGPRVQIDAWAGSYGQAFAVAEAVRKAIDGFRGTMDSQTVQGVFFDNERDFYEDEPELHRISRDYFIWFEEDT